MDRAACHGSEHPPPPPDRPLAARGPGRKPWHILGENGWRILTENLQRKLLSEAHASIKVPSTVKCSVEISRAVFARSTIPARKWRATSASSNRALFLANVEASKIGSCIPRSRKKRNRRL